MPSSVICTASPLLGINERFITFLNIFVFFFNVFHRTYRDGFEGLREHRNKHVDEHDDHTRAVAAEHELADELGHVVTLVSGSCHDPR